MEGLYFSPPYKKRSLSILETESLSLNDKYYVFDYTPKLEEIKEDNDDIGRSIYIYNLGINIEHNIEVYTDDTLYISFPRLIMRQNVPFIISFPKYINSNKASIFLDGKKLEI